MKAVRLLEYGGQLVFNDVPTPPIAEIARNVVESQRLSILIGYATAAPFAIGFLETALAIEDSSNGIWR